jgi:hypothetical protein
MKFVNVFIILMVLINFRSAYSDERDQPGDSFLLSIEDLKILTNKTIGYKSGKDQRLELEGWWPEICNIDVVHKFVPPFQGLQSEGGTIEIQVKKECYKLIDLLKNKKKLKSLKKKIILKEIKNLDNPPLYDGAPYYVFGKPKLNITLNPKTIDQLFSGLPKKNQKQDTSSPFLIKPKQSGTADLVESMANSVDIDEPCDRELSNNGSQNPSSCLSNKGIGVKIKANMKISDDNNFCAGADINKDINTVNRDNSVTLNISYGKTCAD